MVFVPLACKCEHADIDSFDNYDVGVCQRMWPNRYFQGTSLNLVVKEDV